MQKRILSWIAAVLLLGALAALVGCTKEENTPEPPENTDPGVTGFRNTVLYYPSEEGFIVPIMKQIPWEEGIGRAALSYLTDTEDNRVSAAKMGLAPVLPAGTEFTLRIFDDGTARVDFAALPELDSAEAERAMVVSVVNTLTEFSAIDRVEFAEQGKKADALPCGTDVHEPMEAFLLNAEETELAVSGGEAYAMQLYFPNKSGSLNVPVTRYTALRPDLAAHIQALIDGPESEALMQGIPEGTHLLSASAENGIARVDLSAEFWAVAAAEGQTEAVYEAMLLTAMEAGDVYALELTVEGEPFMPAQAVSALPYVNEFR